MYVQTIASSTHGKKEGERWWSFIFSIRRFFGTFSSRVWDIYIGGKLTASDFDKSCRVFLPRTLVTQHRSRLPFREKSDTKKNIRPPDWFHGNLCASNIDMNGNCEGWGRFAFHTSFARDSLHVFLPRSFAGYLKIKYSYPAFYRLRVVF